MMIKINVLLPLIFSVSFNILLAQPPEFQGSLRQMNRQFGMQNSMDHLRMIALMNGGSYNYQTTNKKYLFTVVMANGTQDTVKSRILTDTIKHECYVIKEHKEFSKNDPKRETRIYASQTKRISRLNGYTGAPIVGNTADSCWLFECITGRITAYSFFTENKTNRSYLAAFRLDNGPVRAINDPALKELLTTDAKSLKDLSRGVYDKAIKRYNKQHPIE